MMNFIKENKKAFTFVGGLILTVVVLIIIQFFVTGKKTNKKVETSDYVYTVSSHSSKKGQKSELPRINLKFDEINDSNEVIMELYHSVIKDDKNSFTYEFSIHKEVLFLIIKIDFYDPKSSGLETQYVSYNIDMNTGETLQNYQVLDLYGYTMDDVKQSVEKKMRSFYDTASKMGYVESRECDYLCYLTWRGIKEYQDNVSLYYHPKEKRLVIYRPFLVQSIYNDKEVFKEEPFVFYFEK